MKSHVFWVQINCTVLLYLQFIKGNDCQLCLLLFIKLVDTTLFNSIIQWQQPNSNHYNKWCYWSYHDYAM